MDAPCYDSHDLPSKVPGSTAPLRFCMVTTFYPPYSFGGDGIFVQRLAIALAELGHQVDIIHSVDAYTTLGGSAKTFEAPNHPRIRVHALCSKASMFWPLSVQQLGSPTFESHTLRELLKGPYDVINFHNISLIGGPDLLYFGDAIKLYTLHEYWLVCPMHVLYRFNQEPCTKRTCFACTLAHKRPPQFWRYTEKLPRALANVDAFLALSDFAIEQHRSLGVDSRMRRIAPFVPSEPLATRQDPAPTPYVLYVGRLEAIKGVRELIEAFHVPAPTELWIAGTGSESADLHHLAKLNPRIRFLGHVSGPSLASLYRNAIATVVPSLCYEVAPLVILESFRQRTPVIARRIGGMPEMIDNTGGGFTFADSSEISPLMQLLIADPATRDRMGDAGFDALTQNWNASSHLDQYFGIINEIAAKRHS
jgi:glycosyltransferase involved in cell wall biosynthesis